MTKEERVQELHNKMDLRRRMKERVRTWAAGVCSLALFAGLLVMIGSTGLSHQGMTAGLYSGATLLFESAGGYVLTALIAFMAGVVITVLLKTPHGSKTGDIQKNDRG